MFQIHIFFKLNMSRIQGGKQQNFQVLAEVTFILLLKLQGENPLLRNKKFLNFV